MTATWPQTTAAMGLSPLPQADWLASAARKYLAPIEDRLKMRPACEAADVQTRYHPLDAGSRQCTAMLIPTRTGFHAVVNSALHRSAEVRPGGRHRLRFVLAHELGHTFFYRPGRPPRRSRPADRLEEEFCNRFATSLLVPYEAAKAVEPNPAGLSALARRYDVSIRVAAWAVARAQPSTTVLGLHRAQHPVHGGLEAMRVKWSAGGRFVARGESFKSPLAHLDPWAEGRSVESLRLSGREETVCIQARRGGTSMLAVLQAIDAPVADDYSPTQSCLF